MAEPILCIWLDALALKRYMIGISTYMEVAGNSDFSTLYFKGVMHLITLLLTFLSQTVSKQGGMNHSHLLQKD